MSGIVGLADWKAASANSLLLGELTRSLDYRAPDGCKTWTGANVGLGFALLRTDSNAPVAEQPYSIDGNQWIVADARIDAREDLCHELSTRGTPVAKNAPACELILHAFRAWGEDCISHLRGDFAFAIWDAETQLFFCARDHFGVKPFYYASNSEFFLFSNTLNCVRQHPHVSSEINEAAFGDFLLFGLNYDPSTATYRDIRRLPPASCMVAGRDGLRIQKYWSAPVDGRIRYRDPQEYVDHFRDRLTKAVADRLPSDRAGILLSGGIDSSSLAAMAREQSANANGKPALFAYTVVYEQLIPDQDGRYAREVADDLTIPIKQLAVDDLELFAGWENDALCPAEPIEDPFFAGVFRQFQMIAKDCRVVLSGEGCDNLMYFEMAPYVRDQISRRAWKELAQTVPSYFAQRRFPWKGLARSINDARDSSANPLKFPEWIDPDFARRLNLQQRWRDCLHPTAQRHPILPSGHGSLALPHWVHMFENENPGVTREPVEVRHPFIDLRVVDFLLALPPFPWFFKKKLLRDAMRGKLPETVRLRRKTALAGDPVAAKIEQNGSEIRAKVRWDGEIASYVDRNATRAWESEPNSGKIQSVLRPLSLNLWLQSAQRLGYKVNAGIRND